MTILLTSGLHHCQLRIFTKNTAFYQLFSLKFSFKLVTFCKSYARKQKCFIYELYVCRQTFYESLVLHFFLAFSQNSAHMICVPIRKNCGIDFRNFAFIILGTFRKQFCDSSGAVQAKRFIRSPKKNYIQYDCTTGWAKKLDCF